MEMSLRAARVNADLTQLVAASTLNISKSTLANYEAYRTYPDIDMAKKIAALYGVEVNEISWKAKS